MSNVVFRKIGGRIVPIAAGAALGATVGFAASVDTNKKGMAELSRKIKSNPVDTKLAVARSGVKDVTVISTKQSLKKHFGFLDRLSLNSALKEAQKGSNAFALENDGKAFIIAGKRVNSAVIGHELGHIKDFRRNGTPGFFETGLAGVVTGNLLRREKKGWRNSTVKPGKVKAPALATYERAQKWAHTGAALGAIAGLLYKVKGGK